MNELAALTLAFTLCLVLSILYTAVESALDAMEVGSGQGSPPPVQQATAVTFREDLLNALTLGNLLADMGMVACAALGLRLATGGDPGLLGWVALVLVLTFVLLIPCEMIPRSVGALAPEATIRRWGPWVSVWLRVARPLVVLLTRTGEGVRRTVAGGLRAVHLTTEDVRSAVETVDKHLALETEERDMVNSIFSFGDTTVREVMVPRPDMVAVEEETGLRELLEFAREVEHSRIPVYRATLDNIVGIVHVKDLLARRYGLDGGSGTDGLLREALFIPESKKIDDLLREFQSRGIHIAIVVDEYGGTAGLVTIEDILEEIVGEIQDEHDAEEEPPYSEQPDGSYLVDARMDLDDFGEAVGATFVGDGFETVGGLAYTLFGRVPAVGEEVSSNGFLFTVAQVEGRRIQKLRVSRLPVEAGAVAEGGEVET